KTLDKKTKLEAGVKSSYTAMDADLVYEMHDGNEWEHDPARTNHFVYKENINAAYISMHRDISDKVKMQCGLRAEQFNVSGDQLTTGESFTRSNLSLFPTFFTGYKFNDHNQ